MTKVGFQVNTVNQIALLRNCTFKDSTTFVDELVQNAQRAGATKVSIVKDYNSDTIVVENNGAVLEDFQKLFTIAESGWSEDKVARENPFGIGFFSTLAVSDHIVVESGNQKVEIKIDEILAKGDLTLEIKAVETAVDGFRVTLHDCDKVSGYEFRKKIELLGKFIQTLDIVYNGELQEKKDITTPEGEYLEACTSLQDNLVTGWIGISRYFSSKPKVFYKGRFISELDDMWHLNGELHIPDGTLTLRAPDRKDIIADDKLHAFKNHIKLWAAELAKDVVSSAGTTINERLAPGIKQYLDLEEAINFTKFLTFSGEEIADSKYLKNIISAKIDGHVNNFSEVDTYLKKDVEIPEAHFESIESEVFVQPEDPVLREYTSSSSGSTTYGGILPEQETEEIAGDVVQKLLKKDESVFWVSYNDLATVSRQLSIAKAHKLTLIIARNTVEVEVLERLERLDKVAHISELVEHIEAKAQLEETSLSIKEQRAIVLLDMISRVIGFTSCRFAIGTLYVTKNISIPKADKTLELVVDDALAYFDQHTEKVFIDRTALNTDMLIENISPKVTISDYQFITGNFKMLEEPLSLLLKKEKEEVATDLLEILGKGLK